MDKMNRRELFVGLSGLSAFAALGSVLSFAQEKDAGNLSTSTSADPAMRKSAVLSHSETFPYDKLPVIKLPNGGTQRRVISGTLVTGEFIEVHETMLPVGKMPHPPHKHRNSEILFIRDGKLEFINDGKFEPVGPGGVVFTASNVMHGLKNVGTTPAHYFVIAISRA